MHIWKISHHVNHQENSNCNYEMPLYIPEWFKIVNYHRTLQWRDMGPVVHGWKRIDIKTLENYLALATKLKCTLSQWPTISHLVSHSREF